MRSQQTGNTRAIAASLLQRNARVVTRNALETLGKSMIHSVTRALVAEDGVLRDDDGAIALAAAQAGVQDIQTRVRQEFQSLYPRTVTDALLGNRPFNASQNEQLKREFDKAKGDWQSSIRSQTVHRTSPKIRTQRELMAAKYDTPQPVDVVHGGRTITYRSKYNALNRLWGIDSGLWAAGHLKRISTDVVIQPERNRTKENYEEFVTVNFGRLSRSGQLADAYAYGVAHTSSLNAAGMHRGGTSRVQGMVHRTLVHRNSGIGFEVRSSRNISPSNYFADRMMDAKTRHGMNHPFRSRRLALEVLNESVIRAAGGTR